MLNEEDYDMSGWPSSAIRESGTGECTQRVSFLVINCHLIRPSFNQMQPVIKKICSPQSRCNSTSNSKVSIKSAMHTCFQCVIAFGFLVSLPFFSKGLTVIIVIVSYAPTRSDSSCIICIVSVSNEKPISTFEARARIPFYQSCVSRQE